MPQIKSDITCATMNDKFKVTIQCDCGKESTIGARSLARRWEGETEYRCKSCDIKTYISEPERIIKFKKSFAKVAQTLEHREKCKKNSVLFWTDPIFEESRKYISKCVSQDNKTNQKKIEGRKKALKAFMGKNDYKEHLAKIRAAQDGKSSIPEKITAKLLAEIGVNFEQQFILGPYVYDFKIGNLLIECQGEHWHKDSIAKDSAKATYAANLGYKVMHIWEHEFNETGKVRELLLRRLGYVNGEQIAFEFKNVTVKQIDTVMARVFLGCYHYLPAMSKYGRHYGAFLNDKLIAVVTFSGVVRKEIAERLKIKTSQIRELSRFCIHPDYHKTNFASWCLKRMVGLFKNDMPDVKKLVTFADHDAGHNGNIYKASNWKYDGKTKEDYYYISPEKYRIHKKTVWDRAKKMCMLETDYIAKHEYSKIRCKGKSRFTFDIN